MHSLAHICMLHWGTPGHPSSQCYVRCWIDPTATDRSGVVSTHIVRHVFKSKVCGMCLCHYVLNSLNSKPLTRVDCLTVQLLLQWSSQCGIPMWQYFCNVDRSKQKKTKTSTLQHNSALWQSVAKHAIKGHCDMFVLCMPVRCASADLIAPTTGSALSCSVTVIDAEILVHSPVR